MRASAALAVMILATAGCGDDPADPPDAEPVNSCAPTPPELPTGLLTDPYAFALPATCVVGGLRDLPGRWFVREAGGGFNYSYPRFEGDCETGFRRSFEEVDDDPSDGFTYHQWSDGTRVMDRFYYRFDQADPPFEFVNTQVACMLPDGTLAVAEAYYDTDFGNISFDLTGRRFGPRDELASGLALVGSIGAWDIPIIAYNVAVEGTHAYVVGPYGLDVIDVSDPAQPAHRGHVDGNFNDVKVVRGNGRVVAYLSALYGMDPTRVVDVTNSASPNELAALPEYSHSVFVDGTRLYLATYTNDVPIYDVTDPAVPVLLGVARDPGPDAGIHDLFADGTMIYVNNTTAGFTALDVSAGLTSPAVERGRFLSGEYSHASAIGTANGRRLALHGDEGMAPAGGAHLRVLDGDPAAPGFLTLLGSYQSRLEVGIHNFQLVGDRAYIAYYQDGVRVVDLTDPTQPQEVAHYNTWDDATAYGGAFEGALGIKVVGGLIYVADSARGLVILDEI